MDRDGVTVSYRHDRPTIALSPNPWELSEPAGSLQESESHKDGGVQISGIPGK
ncbi:hypothetical protein CAOG_010100 [Capsaspora owczarzaki ATCC 30864]|uniref:Uncharacterized protein n=1 Tax=Capsaspora owczarzaki (strain ATCC 30864) TaxID=595528 RepID=A0A0D2WX49_CAPO3|nr:hypothetical protein CAOG_010100 [Capsaspora owczarzaki ATCC 30864]